MARLSRSSSSSTALFADLAKDFCLLIKGRGRKRREGFLQQTHRLLPRLYSAALALPDRGAPKTGSIERLSRDEWHTLYRSLRTFLGASDLYCQVFDPYDRKDEAPVLCSLSDDIADIYGELEYGLRFWRAGDKANAIRAWQFFFTIEWGRHLVRALHSLNSWRYDHDMRPVRRAREAA